MSFFYAHFWHNEQQLYFKEKPMIKYILGLIIILAIILVAVTVGANNDQVINL